MNSSSSLSMHPQSSDIELARSIAAGDHDAFKVLMRRHNQTLYRTARSILRNDGEAEDVVQEAYLLAYRSIQGFRGDAKLSTWLIRIVVNLAIRRKQRQRRDGEVFTDVPDASDEGARDMGETHGCNPEATASNNELRQMLEAHIDRLPDMYRQVFVLRGIEELNVEETAEVLGIPEATVRTRFFRARHTLREGLAKDIDFALNDAFSFAGDRCDRIVAGVLDALRNSAIEQQNSSTGEAS
ncbi:RNA polymerase sigma factor [Denitratisoma oestradiolicum]|uniref:RNA polymerase sigma factor n=1 Tax=Denitratisoma oestradiolicum TaxID=311182 RepID=A0A6S6XNN8_9PROT|nr:RNA polymerase sigma factor [Denitratisoma oestradiolicum]TWO78684.1 RNA polymerase subunit sigma [Denitratisoma oestradiolicum]CAB1367551.1 RNA polymerase sigma factor [Denitratisoma oestradiolicum]